MVTKRSNFTSKCAVSSLASQEIAANTIARKLICGHFHRELQLLHSVSLGKEQNSLLQAGEEEIMNLVKVARDQATTVTIPCASAGVENENAPFPLRVFVQEGVLPAPPSCSLRTGFHWSYSLGSRYQGGKLGGGS